MKGYKTLSQIMTFANGETFLFISYNDCIFTQAECVLHSNVTPFNLHLSSIIFDTHILSWSLYNIAPGFLFLSFLSLSLSLSLFLRTITVSFTDVWSIWRDAKLAFSHFLMYITSRMIPEIILPSVRLSLLHTKHG